MEKGVCGLIRPFGLQMASEDMEGPMLTVSLVLFSENKQQESLQYGHINRNLEGADPGVEEQFTPEQP